MKSQNFEFLRSKRAVLADLGGFAERYAHSDPASSLIKQRGLVEQLVIAIYEVYRLHSGYSDNLNDLMTSQEFEGAVPEIILQKFHAVRKAGNWAAHPIKAITPQLSLERLQQTFEVAQWFFIQVERGSRTDCPAYQAPPPDLATNAKAREALEKLRLAEAKYESVLVGLEEERKKRALAEQVAETSAAELARLRSEGQQVAATLHFNELTTRRRLIDQMLIDAGWVVGENGANTDSVRQEVLLTGQPTLTGDGYADYVLYGANGKPLGVVEAKKTVKDAR